MASSLSVDDGEPTGASGRCLHRLLFQNLPMDLLGDVFEAVFDPPAQHALRATCLAAVEAFALAAASETTRLVAVARWDEEVAGAEDGEPFISENLNDGGDGPFEQHDAFSVAPAVVPSAAATTDRRGRQRRVASSAVPAVASRFGPGTTVRILPPRQPLPM
jgi:hypothetical protein